MLRIWVFLAGFTLMCAAVSTAQEKPLTMNGTIYTGYYSSYTRGGGTGDQSINFAAAGGKFDINGFYLSPDLLEYSIQPQFNAGPQASDANFEGGNGLTMRVTALRNRASTVTFRYSNVQLTDAYFGSLTQVSSFTRDNRNKDIGLTAELKPKGLPSGTLDWGAGSTQSQSFTSGIPDYTSRSSHTNLNLAYQRWGWDFTGFASHQHLMSDLFTPQEGASSTLSQTIGQYRWSARRGFLQDSELYIDGGNQSTSNVLLNQPMDLTTRYSTANLRLFQRKRWKTSFRAAYTSNISGLVMTQLVGGLTGNGSIAPDSSILVPLQHTVSYLDLSGLTSLDLSHGFTMYGNVDRTAVVNASDSALSSRYMTMAGGVTYAKTLSWASFSGQYGRSVGNGSVTGQTGRIDGQNYAITIQPGKWNRLKCDLTVRGTDQSVRNDLPTSEHSFAADQNITLHIFGQFSTSLGGGWQQNAFRSVGSDFRSNGYSARLGIDHPRFQVNGSINSSVGTSLQPFTQTFGGIIGAESALLTPLRLIPSDLRGITLSLHANPMRRLELSGLYTRSIQHLEGMVANDFEVIDVYAKFHFRKLEFVAGYFTSSQIYSSYLATYPQTDRGRYYVRIVRNTKFL